MSENLLSKDMWIPNYQHKEEHIYILLTSLNLGGAEKIVSDQLWANSCSKFPRKVTLIVIYDQTKEHSIPPDVNVIRLNNDIQNGELIFSHIAYEKKPLVCHLINDQMAKYLFSKNLYLHLVIHNDKRGWSNSEAILNHPQIISLVAVCDYVKQQLETLTEKRIYTFRHNIKNYHFDFNIDERIKVRKAIGVQENTLVIGMTGRISEQKNYFLACDVVYDLKHRYPEKQFKLVILGGVSNIFKNLYIKLMNRIHILGIHKEVLLAGFQQNAHEWINCFDVALNTSYFEGLSMATQEFMQNGLQVVLSDVCGQKEILDKKNQLHFFEFPKILNNPSTQNLHLKLTPQTEHFITYKRLVETISQLVIRHARHRIKFDEDYKTNLDRLSYGSHSVWNLLHSIYPIKAEQPKQTAFLTSNLMLGGAQRSLVNLLTYYKKNGYSFPLILLNQSNQTQFYEQILKQNIEHYLCHSSRDVFDICNNLFNYIFSHNIKKIILWNVDVKVKLLLNKFLLDIEIVDVSPGDYAFLRMENEKLFQEAIYHDEKNFYRSLSAYVSKYEHKDSDYYLPALKDKSFVIPNGVVLDEQYLADPSCLKENFTFLVCGRIAPSKHLEIIFSALEKFIVIHPEVKMYVYGNAENYNMAYYEQLMNSYQHLIDSGHILFMGHHDRPQTIMKHYHSLIVLGTHQGSPNIVLEAASCKLPVIANDSGGTKEIISDDTGILLPTTPDVEYLLEAMQKVYDDYPLATKKADNCFALIKEKFSMEKMAEKYLKVILDEF